MQETNQIQIKSPIKAVDKDPRNRNFKHVYRYLYEFIRKHDLKLTVSDDIHIDEKTRRKRTERTFEVFASTGTAPLFRTYFVHNQDPKTWPLVDFHRCKRGSKQYQTLEDLLINMSIKLEGEI